MPECRNALNMKYMEDRFISVRLYFFAKAITKVDRSFYHYIKHNPASANSAVTQTHFLNMQLFWNSVEEFLQSQQTLDTYRNMIGFLKLKDKATLMLGANSVELRKEFAYMFTDEEIHFRGKLKLGERMLLFLVRHKLFFMTQLLRELILLKNRIF